MHIAAARMRFRADWVESLKDKRTVVKSLIARTRNKFNVSIAETDLQDVWKEFEIGIAVIASDAPHADRQINHVVRWMEENTDAEMTVCDVEML